MTDPHRNFSEFCPGRRLGVPVMVLALLSFAGSSVTAFEWSFDREYTSPLMYLHALVNYNQPPRWEDDWQANLIKTNGVRLNFGSVTTARLLSDFQLVLNEDLGHGWWFSHQFNWYGSLHRDNEVKELWLGLEKTIYKPSSVFFHFNPAFDKEEIDFDLGLMVADVAREKYLQLALVVEDFVYDEKNDFGGQTIRQPWGIRWQSRYAGPAWRIFTRGNYSRGYLRQFPDIELAPEIASAQQKTNDGLIRFSLDLEGEAHLELAAKYYYFFERQERRLSNQSYAYENDIQQYTLKYLRPWRSGYNIRGELHHVRQDAWAGGYRQYDYRRREWLPAIFGEFPLWSAARGEVGYLVSFYSWDLDDRLDEGYDQRDLVDKVKLGFTYLFPSGARLHFSLSHELSLARFGGGNIQLIHFF